MWTGTAAAVAAEWRNKWEHTNKFSPTCSTSPVVGNGARRETAQQHAKRSRSRFCSCSWLGSYCSTAWVRFLRPDACLASFNNVISESVALRVCVSMNKCVSVCACISVCDYMNVWVLIVCMCVSLWHRCLILALAISVDLHFCCTSKYIDIIQVYVKRLISISFYYVFMLSFWRVRLRI